MIDYLSAAAEAANGYEAQGVDPEIYTLLSVTGWALLHAVLPLIGGAVYADHWRALWGWVAALAVASFSIHVGYELWSVATYDNNITVSDAILQTAMFVFLPAFGATATGILFRRIWVHRMTKDAKARVHG